MGILRIATDLVMLALYRIQARYRQHPRSGIRRASPIVLQKCMHCAHAGYKQGRAFHRCKATSLIVHRDDGCKRFTVDDRR